MIGNVAVEVKRVKNVVHTDTVVNALAKLHSKLIQDFDVKVYNIVFQTRCNGKRDQVRNVRKDVHGVMKRLNYEPPYKIGHNGTKIFIHVQKVDEQCFQNIGFER